MKKNELKRYDTYKPSGVEWLREIPKHWELRKGKWIFKKEERFVRENDDIITCFRDGQVTLRANRKTEGFTNALKEHGYQGIRKGDLVIHNMDAFAGAIGVSDSDGKSTPVYSVCTPRFKEITNSYYYAYFLRNLAKNGFIESLAKGIRERSTDFRFNDFGVIELPLPSISEQTAITQFLDSKTALIDKAIALKEKQIALLKERRQVVIHQAVTKGLNSSAPMKDSGIDWIGQIPAHWEMKKLKFISKTQGRIGFKGYAVSDLVGETEGALTLGASHFDWEGNLNLNDPVFISWKKYYESPEIMISQYDILIVQRGSTCGKVAFVSDFIGPATINPSLVLLKEIKENPKYVFLGIKVMLNTILNLINNTAIPMLTQYQLNNIFIPIPPLSEQLVITAYVDKISSAIDKIVLKKQQEIEKLKEYKASLINSAVTGKIKVT